MTTDRCLCGGRWPCPDRYAPNYRPEAYQTHTRVSGGGPAQPDRLAAQTIATMSKPTHYAGVVYCGHDHTEEAEAQRCIEARLGALRVAAQAVVDWAYGPAGVHGPDWRVEPGIMDRIAALRDALGDEP